MRKATDMEPTTEATTFQAVTDRQQPIREWHRQLNDPTNGTARYMNESTVRALRAAFSADNPEAAAFTLLAMYTLRHPHMGVEEMVQFDPNRAVMGDPTYVRTMLDRDGVDPQLLKRVDSDLQALATYAPSQSNAFAVRTYIAYLLGDERLPQFAAYSDGTTTVNTIMGFLAAHPLD